MLKFFAKCFETVCCILAVINFIFLGSLGGFLGYYLADNIIFEDPVLYAILLSFAGIAIAFFINVLSFGLISQITEIRRNLELFSSKYGENDSSKKEIKENGEWKCPSCGSMNPANDKLCYCGYKRV